MFVGEQFLSYFKHVGIGIYIVERERERERESKHASGSFDHFYFHLDRLLAFPTNIMG
jgi:hypothetical protein